MHQPCQLKHQTSVYGSGPQLVPPPLRAKRRQSQGCGRQAAAGTSASPVRFWQHREMHVLKP